MRTSKNLMDCIATAALQQQQLRVPALQSQLLACNPLEPNMVYFSVPEPPMGCCCSPGGKEDWAVLPHSPPPGFHLQIATAGTVSRGSTETILRNHAACKQPDLPVSRGIRPPPKPRSSPSGRSSFQRGLSYGSWPHLLSGSFSVPPQRSATHLPSRPAAGEEAGAADACLVPAAATASVPSAAAAPRFSNH